MQDKDQAESPYTNDSASPSGIRNYWNEEASGAQKAKEIADSGKYAAKEVMGALSSGGGGLKGKEGGTSPISWGGGKEPSSETAKDIESTARTARRGIQGARALGGDATAASALAKDIASHPVQATKDAARATKTIIKVVLASVLLAVSTVFIIILLVVLVVQKAAILLKSNTELIWRPDKIASQMRVNMDVAEFLWQAVPYLTYERQQQTIAKNKGGIVIAQEAAPDPIGTGITDTETLKTFNTWADAGLAATFTDYYKGDIRPISTTTRGKFNPDEWALFVNNRNLGTLSSDKAQGFLSVFTQETTHWDDIYLRKAMRDIAQKKYGVNSFKKEYPKISATDLESGRTNVTKQLVQDTLQPIADNSQTYFKCLVEGGGNCNSLGFGTNDAERNTPDISLPIKGGIFGTIGSMIATAIQNIRTAAGDKLINSTGQSSNLSSYLSTVSPEIEGGIGSANDRSSLVAKINTGVSESILSDVSKDIDGAPDTDVLLEMYDRYKLSIDNGNYSRVSYDRNARQSVAQAMTYFIGGGQIVNHDIGFAEATAITDNIGGTGESSIFQSMYSQNGFSVFAQGEGAGQPTNCSLVYNDTLPVNSPGTDYRERDIKSDVCFTKSLLPKKSDLETGNEVNQIFKQLKDRNAELDSTGIFSRIGDILSTLNNYNSGKIRTSPVAAKKTAVDDNLSPDFDAYINQTYGTSLTGAETNGEAFDTMWQAGEALVSDMLTSDTYGTGAVYQTDTETAASLRYANKIERESMAFRSVSERFLSFNYEGSLVSRIAMEVPTNKSSGVSFIARITSPSTMMTNIASRFVPQTYAATTANVNPVNAVRFAYPVSDQSNRLSRAEFESTYQCSSGGNITQERAQPSDVPFDVPVNTTDPCKRNSVLQLMSRCWFSESESCSIDSTANSQLPSSVDVSEKAKNTSNMSCAPGATSERVVDYIDTNAGITSAFKLCDYGDIVNINASWSTNVKAMIDAAAKDGIHLGPSNGFRPIQRQIEIRQERCPGRVYDRSCKGRPPVAVPGRSNHGFGLAMDFSNMCYPSSTCGGNARYNWLVNNAGKFGIKKLRSEAWHWSVDGG